MTDCGRANGAKMVRPAVGYPQFMLKTRHSLLSQAAVLLARRTSSLHQSAESWNWCYAPDYAKSRIFTKLKDGLQSRMRFIISPKSCCCNGDFDS